MDKQKPLLPVKPSGMEILFYYTCPHCGRKVPLVAPLQPAMAQCDSCSNKFPVVPADQKSIRFLKTVLDNGRAGINPDFL